MRIALVNEICKGLISLSITTLVVAGIILFSHGHINAESGNDFGIYSSGLSGLPAYWNPLINLSIAAETVAFLALPAVLFLVRKKISIRPLAWLFAALIMGAFLDYGIAHSEFLFKSLLEGGDPNNDSFFADFIRL